jgi:o-succinylbenzoate---CoA ligase
VADLTCPVAEWAKQTPEHPALISSQNTVSYRELQSRIGAAVEFFQGAGIERDGRVALQLANSVEAIIAIFALMRIGAISCLMNTRWPADPTRHQVVGLGCRYFIHGKNWHGRLDQVAQMDITTLPAVSGTVMASETKMSVGSPAVAIFTSGTTARPKAALLSYGNLYFNALGSNDNLPIVSSDRWLLSLPLYHVGGLGILFRSFVAGGTVVIPEPGEDLALTVQSFGITHLSIVTTQLYRLLADPAQLSQLRGLKAILLGGSAVASSLIARSLEVDLPIYTSYGLSEMGSQVATTSPKSSLAQLQTSGKILRHRELTISSQSEILVRGDCRFLGYLTDSELLKPFDPDGWFATGDLGVVDADGYLSVVGRKDNLFVSGGENIQPEEIERVLLDDLSVEEAMVVPIESAEFGFRPIAFVKIAPHPEHGAADLLAILREKLPGYMIPDQILPWPSHLGALGIKPSRTELRSLARQALK